MNVRQAISRLRAVRRRVASPAEFYQAHVSGWTELAQTTAVATLVNLRPEETDAETWGARVDAAARRIAARVSRLEPVGVVLAMSDLDTGLPQDASAAAAVAYAAHPVTLDEVQRWVAAGREKLSPDDAGKNLDERDTDEDDTQIAWKVLTAINNERPGGAGLEAAIQKFLDVEREVGDLTPEMYQQVLVAWLDVFTPVAAAAWAAWVRGLVAAV